MSDCPHYPGEDEPTRPDSPHPLMRVLEIRTLSEIFRELELEARRRGDLERVDALAWIETAVMTRAQKRSREP